MKKYDVIIMGAGIAGLTAAIYARRAGKSTLVLEAKTHGGQIINTFDIQNWPGEESVSGVDLMQKIYHQANNLGAEIEYEEVTGIVDNGDSVEATERFTVKTEDAEYVCGAIIIATGSVERRLDVPGEEKFIGRGVSFCATCDGAFYKDQPVAVVGGGNTAFYDALYLADLCSKVYLVHRRREFRADAILVEKLRARQNVEFLTPFVPTEVLGDKKVTGLSIREKEGTREQKLDVSGVFVAVGRLPQTEIFAELVSRDGAGYIEAGEDCVTSRPGIFVAGDVRTKAIQQLTTAAADGTVAATEAVRFLG